VPERQAQLDELNEQLQEAYEAEPFNEDVVKNLEDDIELFTLGATRIEVPTGKVKERTFPSISITPQMKAEAQKGFTLFQAEGSGADSTAKARAEAIRQNRERMQARREAGRWRYFKAAEGRGDYTAAKRRPVRLHDKDARAQSLRPYPICSESLRSRYKPQRSVSLRLILRNGRHRRNAP
jgi:regulator of protease activity HflC (stomatin/prohibitin superfamily)